MQHVCSDCLDRRLDVRGERVAVHSHDGGEAGLQVREAEEGWSFLGENGTEEGIRGGLWESGMEGRKRREGAQAPAMECAHMICPASSPWTQVAVCTAPCAVCGAQSVA